VQLSFRFRLAAATAGFLLAGPASLTAQPTPLPSAYAHNDERHARPLLDALDRGFCNVEADVWLLDGELLVGHDRGTLKKERTLRGLYLDPLRERIRQNGGSVFPNGPRFTLFMDVKSNAELTYQTLRDVLKPYADILTVFTPTNTVTNALTIILSGNRPTRTLAAELSRFAAIDGRLPDLDTNASPHLIPVVSDTWFAHFKWRGAGPRPDDERQKLRQYVQRAHQQGRCIRFWAAPDHPAGWREMQQAGVDLLNTDDLAGLQRFLLDKSP
jgi:hypothetical protein